MNVGFYIHSVGSTGENDEIYEALNKAIENNDVTDASVFFNDIDFNPVKPKFGMFNATDIWAFTGLLVATTLDNVLRASKIVNKFKLLYLHNNKEKNLFALLDIVNRIPILVKNETDSSEIYRLTGKKPKMIPNLSIKKMLEVM